MALPEVVSVKLSSEDAGAISLTRVVTQQMNPSELLGAIIAVTAKDTARIHRILHGGTLLDGGTRYRWNGFEASEDEIKGLLARFPDPDPTRPFSDRYATAVILRFGGSRTIPLSREAAAKRRFLRRRSFWEVLLSLLQATKPRYLTYSYREQADLYRWQPSPSELAAISKAADLLVHSFLARLIRTSTLSEVDFLVRRSS